MYSATETAIEMAPVMTGIKSDFLILLIFLLSDFC